MSELEKVIVPLHEADVERRKANCKEGRCIELCGERKLEVWKNVENDGLFVWIFRPTNDGKTAKLAFGLSREAAIALHDLLCCQLNEPQ